MMQTSSNMRLERRQRRYSDVYSHPMVSVILVKVNCLLDSVMYDEAVFVVVGLLWFWQSMSLMNITVHTCQSNKLINQFLMNVTESRS